MRPRCVVTVRSRTPRRCADLPRGQTLRRDRQDLLFPAREQRGDVTMTLDAVGDERDRLDRRTREHRLTGSCPFDRGHECCRLGGLVDEPVSADEEHTADHGRIRVRSDREHGVARVSLPDLRISQKASSGSSRARLTSTTTRVRRTRPSETRASSPLDACASTSRSGLSATSRAIPSRTTATDPRGRRPKLAGQPIVPRRSVVRSQPPLD